MRLRTKNSIPPMVEPITAARLGCCFAVERSVLKDVVVLDDGVGESEADTVLLLGSVPEKLDIDGSRLVSTLWIHEIYISSKEPTALTYIWHNQTG